MSYPPDLIAFAPAWSATTVYICRRAVVPAAELPGPAPAGTLVAPISARVARTVNRATRRFTSGLPPSRSCARPEEHGLCTETYDGRMDRGNPAERLISQVACAGPAAVSALRTLRSATRPRRYRPAPAAPGRGGGRGRRARSATSLPAPRSR